MCFKLVASMGCLTHFFGHRDKHVVFNILYYNFAGDVGVGSSLMAPKDKGEGEGRMTC